MVLAPVEPVVVLLCLSSVPVLPIVPSASHRSQCFPSFPVLPSASHRSQCLPVPVTVVALEGLGSGVFAVVSGQLVAPGEAPLAAVPGALVGLFPWTHTHTRAHTHTHTHTRTHVNFFIQVGRFIITVHKDRSVNRDRVDLMTVQTADLY